MRHEVKQNKSGKIVLKLDYSDMVDFCAGLSEVVNLHVIAHEKPLRSAVNPRQILLEMVLLEMYNRLQSRNDNPLRTYHNAAEKYSVKLSPAEAVAYWMTVNPLEHLQVGRPVLRPILDSLYKLFV